MGEVEDTGMEVRLWVRIEVTSVGVRLWMR